MVTSAMKTLALFTPEHRGSAFSLITTGFFQEKANVHVLGTGSTRQVIICVNHSGPSAASSDNVSKKLFKGEFKSSGQMRRRRPRKWLARLYLKIPLK